MSELKPGHDTFVTVTNALLAARDKASGEEKMDGFNLRAVFDVLLALGLDQATALQALHDHGDQYPDYASEVETSDDLEVDAAPLFSAGEDGVWVMAWVHVRHPDKEEWSCDNCGETSMDGSGTCITCGADDEQEAEAANA